jgi:hypothetical protein
MSVRSGKIWIRGDVFYLAKGVIALELTARIAAVNTLSGADVAR